MKTNFPSRSEKHSIMALFAHKVGGNPYKRFPDAYYRPIWFTKLLFEGIDFIATVERKSKKRMANELMALAISTDYAEKIREYNNAVAAVMEQRRIIGASRFILM